MSLTVCDRLLFPLIMEFVPFDDLLMFQQLNKYMYHKIQNDRDNGGYWQLLCANYAIKYGLYHTSNVMTGNAAKLHLLKDLVPSRKKWILDEQGNAAESFKVRTMCRFRPGNSCTGKVLLPLHQFLKLRREKKQQQNADEQQSEINASDPLSKFGQRVPEEYLDPILGTIMKDPVRLVGSSERIVDRTVALQCIHHGGGRDPFDGTLLDMSMMVSERELKTKIIEWTKLNIDYDPSVSITDLKTLIEEGNEVNPLLLEALMEAQQLSAASNKVYCESKFGSGTRSHHTHEEDMLVNGDATDNVGGALSEDISNLHGLSAKSTSTDIDDKENNPNLNTLNEDINSLNENSKKAKAADTSKIVDVNTVNSFVSMHIPGLGVKAFHYSQVFHEKGRSVPTVTGRSNGTGKVAHHPPNAQSLVYEKSTREAVFNVMNGYNACVLCYGQTGSGKTFTLFGDSDAIEALYCRHVKNNPVVSLSPEVLHLWNTTNDTNDTTSSHVSQYHDNNPTVIRSMNTTSIHLSESAGMVIRTCIELLEAREQLLLRTCSSEELYVVIHVQIIEIYNEKATDLLTGKSILIRRDTGEPVGAVSMPVQSIHEMIVLLHIAQKRKRFASTAMNDYSSRSHTALILTVEQTRTVHDTSAAKDPPQTVGMTTPTSPTPPIPPVPHNAGDSDMNNKCDNHSQWNDEDKSLPCVSPLKGSVDIHRITTSTTSHTTSTITLVDLAGSERIKKSQVTGHTKAEAVGINMSLLVLGKVISSLIEGKTHIPYFESKLTTLLKNVFGGNCRTNVLIHCRPDEAHTDETLQSMRFGERCSMILNELKTAATSKESTIKAIDIALERMRKQLYALRQAGNTHLDAYKKVSQAISSLSKKRQEIEFM